MSRYCPITGTKVVYLMCLECKNKECKKQYKSVDKLNDNPSKIELDIRKNDIRRNG